MEVRRFTSGSFILVMSLIAAMLTGCGDGRPRRVPVSGQVLIDGKPLTYGFVRFATDTARPATGQIDSDGRFTLSTFGDEDGAVMGEQKVSVMAAETINSNSKRWHAPKKYTSPTTSGLTAKIDGPIDSLTIELTWAGGRPYIERLTGGE